MALIVPWQKGVIYDFEIDGSAPKIVQTDVTSRKQSSLLVDYSGTSKHSTCTA